jgi:hypothetical protein
MYIDLIVLIGLLIFAIIFSKRFSSFVFFVAIIDIFLRIVTFISNNLGSKDFSRFVNKYFPGSIFAIIDKYSSSTFNLILKWLFVITMIFFLYYITKIFINKKKF